MQVYLNYDCILEEKVQPFVYDQNRTAEYEMQYNKTLIKNRGYYQTPVFLQKSVKPAMTGPVVSFSAENYEAKIRDTSKFIHRNSNDLSRRFLSSNLTFYHMSKPMTIPDVGFLFCYSTSPYLKIYHSFMVDKIKNNGVQLQQDLRSFHDYKNGIQIQEEINASEMINCLYRYQDHFVSEDRNDLFLFLNFQGSTPQKEIAIQREISLLKSNYGISSDSEILIYHSIHNEIAIHRERLSSRLPKEFSIFSSFLVEERELPSLNIYQDYFARVSQNTITLPPILKCYNKDDIGSVSLYQNEMVSKERGNVFTVATHFIKDKIKLVSSIFTSLFGKKENLKSSIETGPCYGEVSFKLAQSYFDKMGTKELQTTFLNESSLGKITSIKELQFGREDFSKKEHLHVFMLDYYYGIKEDKTIRKEMHNQVLSVTETTTALYSFDHFVETEKLPLEIFDYLSNSNSIGSFIPVFKDGDTLNSLHGYFLSKDEKESRLSEKLQEFKKGNYNSLLNPFLTPMELKEKEVLYSYLSLMTGKRGLEISISNDIEFIKKSKESGLLHGMIEIGKGALYSNYQEDTSLQKKEKDTLLDSIPYFINRKEKLVHDTNELWVQQKPKETFILYKDTTIQKNAHKTVLNSFVTDIFKDRQETMLDLPLKYYQKRRRKTMLEEYNLNATKGIIEVGYEKEELYLKTLPKAIMNGRVISLEDKNSKGLTLSKVFWADKNSSKESSYYQEIKKLTSIKKELEKNVEHHYNWVWIEGSGENPLPQNEHYGIDELLIPENDFDYTRFEDVIFNKKTLKPIKPVKIIDDHTFIAKYPIKHPVQKYEEIAKEYIDIPSDLMYTIYNRFYEIWYANVFKFGNMDMVSAINLMMDYMHIYVMTQYGGTDLLEEALRVLKQIRWFAETSVIKNAEYLITFEYEDLKSNLQTGYCEIQNRTENFYIDKTLKVFSSDKESYGKEAYIEFTVSNAIETTITFSISFLHGFVDVFINEDHVQTLTKSSSMVELTLEPTRTQNKIKIVRSKTSNVSYCYVGNVVIKNGKYKNLEITFDNTKKNGNLPMNDVIQKLINLATMYENNVEVFNKFKQGNMAMSALFEELKNYWTLHHEGKVKGKRLTIKET